MSNKARLEALTLTRNTQENFVWFSPEPEEYCQFEPNSRVAIEYWWSLKPRRYASLARVMGGIINDHLFGENDLFRQYLSEPVRLRNNDPWHRFCMNAHVALQRARDGVMDTTAYHDAQRFSEILRRLSPDKYIDLDTVLDAGGHTMTTTMLTTLRNLPRLIQHHDEKIKTAESGAIARNSIGLPWLLAMPSINQMMAMKAVLAKETHIKKWTNIDALLDPQEYRLQMSNDETLALHYANLMQAELPADFTILTPHKSRPGLRVQDIPPHDHAPVIGCPITLINQAVYRLWEAQIDAVEGHELWTYETDPRFIQPPYQLN